MRRALLTAALLALACASRPQAEPAPAAGAQDVLPGEREALAREPALGPIPPFEGPVPRIEVLPNGLPLYIVERPGAGIEAIQLWIRGGATADPEASPGLASLTAELMEAGAAGKTQTEIAAAADAIGMSLGVNALQDAVVVSGSAMTVSLAPMTALLADVALRPDLLETEWEKVRAQREAMLLAERAEPAVAALRAFRAAVFAGTALGRPIEGTLAAVKRTNLADVRATYASFGPGNAALVAVGGADPAKVVAALRSAFGTWQGGKARAAARLAEPPGVRPRLVFVDYPGKPQSVLVVGQPAVPRSSPDHLALEVLNAVVGGSFTSRLNQNLREQHGYSYGASSRFEWTLGRSPFSARSSVKTDVTGPALTEMLSELRRAADEPLQQAELDKGRALLAYRLVDTLSHASQLAAAVAQIWLYSLPVDEYRTYVPRLQSLSVDSIQAAAHRALQPARMTIAVAGDKTRVLPQLAPLSLGPPELRDPAGDRLP